MFNRILVGIDNSDFSNPAVDVAISIAKKFGSRLVGCHVYASRLHNEAFGKLEFTLPSQYQKEDTLREQRTAHFSLITKGLELISQSYLNAVEERCKASGVHFERRLREGKNFEELVKEAENDSYDLLVISNFGLGKVKRSLIGSTCERVAQRVGRDILVVKNGETLKNGPCLVAIDGSPHSYAALNRAIEFSQRFGVAIEAIHVFDPNFHTRVFSKLVDVLSDEVAKIFRFEQQETLHKQVINEGLRKVGEAHLRRAVRFARAHRIELGAHVLEGKPFEKILEYAETKKSGLIFTGKFGIHRCETMDIGSTTQNLLRLSACSHYISSDLYTHGKSQPKVTATGRPLEIEDTREEIPTFVEEMVKTAVKNDAE